MFRRVKIINQCQAQFDTIERICKELNFKVRNSNEHLVVNSEGEKSIPRP
jgi:hypothetical protein